MEQFRLPHSRGTASHPGSLDIDALISLRLRPPIISPQNLGRVDKPVECPIRTSFPRPSRRSPSRLFRKYSTALPISWASLLTLPLHQPENDEEVNTSTTLHLVCPSPLPLPSSSAPMPEIRWRINGTVNNPSPRPPTKRSLFAVATVVEEEEQGRCSKATNLGAYYPCSSQLSPPHQGMHDGSNNDNDSDDDGGKW